MKNQIARIIYCSVGFFVFVLFLQTQAQAQDVKVDVASTGAQIANQPPNATSSMQNAEVNSNALVVVSDDKGTVEVTTTDDNGTKQTVKTGKPSVNTSVDYDTDAAVYSEAFSNWMKANPNYADYLSNEELQCLKNNDMPGLYKYSYKLAFKSSQK